MKHLFLAAVLLVSMATPMSASPAAPPPPIRQRVTVQFVSIDLFVVLAQVASDVGLQLVHEHLGGNSLRVSVEADNQPAASVVDEVTRKTHTSYLVAGRALVVGTPSWVQRYRDTTTFTVTYANVKPDEAIQIVQNVFPYVEATVTGADVKFVVPKVHLDRVKDIATSLDNAK